MDARHDARLQVGVDPPYDCPLVPTYFSHFLVLGAHWAGKSKLVLQGLGCPCAVLCCVLGRRLRDDDNDNDNDNNDIGGG